MPKKSSPPAQGRKPFKPSPDLVDAVQTMQALAEDDAAWNVDDTSQLHLLRAAVQRIDSLQQAQSFHDILPTRTASSLSALSSWAHTKHSIDLSSCGLRLGFLSTSATTSAADPDPDVDVDVDNATLFATRPIYPGDTLILIPEPMILTAHSSARLKADLTTLAHHGPAIARSPSLALSLTLLMHRYKPNRSAFFPYTDSLPTSFHTPLYAFRDDPVYYAALAPSAKAHASALRTLRAQLRDYAGVFRALCAARVPSLPLAVFSLANFRWAISVVMTRQNALPQGADASPRAQPTMALVPLWDMFNHEQGPRTTLVTLSAGRVCVQCTAMRKFSQDEPVTMCYGPRPAPQLALYSGFVPAQGTPYDEVHVPTSLFVAAHAAPAQQLVQIAPLKARVLGKRGISIDLDPLQPGAFRATVPLIRTHVIDKLVGVAAVAVMTKAEFAAFLKSQAILPSLLEVQALQHEQLAYKIAREALLETRAPYREALSARDAELSSSSSSTSSSSSASTSNYASSPEDDVHHHHHHQKETPPPNTKDVDKESNGAKDGNAETTKTAETTAKKMKGSKYDGVDWDSPAGKLIAALLDVEVQIVDDAVQKLDELQAGHLALPRGDGQEQEQEQMEAAVQQLALEGDEPAVEKEAPQHEKSYGCG